MAQRTRQALKDLFVAGRIPTQENFADLIDSQVNSADDYILRPQGSPLSLFLGDGQTGPEKLLNLQRAQGDTPSWTLALNPGFPASGQSGLGFLNGADQTRLYLSDDQDGRVGIGTTAPKARLHVHSLAGPGANTYASLQNALTLELGQNADGGAGSIKMHGAQEDQFSFIKPGSESLQIDTTSGHYIFNGDPGVSGAKAGQLSIKNGSAQTTVSLKSAGDSFLTGGRLGIGVQNPLETLHLGGAIRGTVDGGRLVINTEHGDTTIGMGNTGWSHFNTKAPLFYFDKGIHINGGALSAYEGHNLKLQVRGNTKLTILDSNGNVGIGTENPLEVLHINGNLRGPNEGRLKIQTDSGYMQFGAGNADWAHFYTDLPKYYFDKAIYVDGGMVSSYFNYDLSLQTGGSTHLTIKNGTGRVGIGTDAPLAMLHIGEWGGNTPRDWMKYGTYSGHGSDGMYVGMKYMGVSNRADAVIAWGDDTNDMLSFIYAGSGVEEVERMQLRPDGTLYLNGKMGIAQSNPQTALHLGGAIRGHGSGGRLVINTPSGDTTIGMGNTTWSHFDTTASRFYFEKGIHVNSGEVSAYQGNDLKLQVGGNTKMTILESNGNVGIGTTSPSHQLTLGGVGVGNGMKVGSYLHLGNTSYGNMAFLSINAYLSKSEASGSNLGNWFKPNWNKGSGMVMSQSGGGWGDVVFHGIQWGSTDTERQFPQDFTEVMRIKTNGEFLLGGAKPIFTKRYNSLGDAPNYNTGYATSEYTAAIAGFWTRGVDIYEGGGGGDFIRCRMESVNGKWHIISELRSHNDHEDWYVDVLFISTRLSQAIGY